MSDLNTRTGNEAKAAAPMPKAGALFGLRLPELQAVVAGLGQKPYRARQIFQALYRERVAKLDDMTTLPAELRTVLKAHEWTVGLPEIVQTAVSVDGTERYLVRMADGETVETVWMPDGDGGERGDGSEAAAEEAGEVVGAVDAVAGESHISFGKDDKENESDEARGGEGRSDAASSRIRADSYRTGKRMRPESRQDQPVVDWRDAHRALVPIPYRLEGQAPAPSSRKLGVLARRGFRRATICISSQVGCAVNCQFCLTAKLGIRRNLTAGEIAGQVAAVLNRHAIEIGQDRINLVFMGMGEPFLNYPEFMRSVRLLVEGVGIPESRMTVSTSGILPGIQAFAAETIRPKLALSLNASNDLVRERVMPITRKWNIAALLEAVSRIPLRTREWVTFEYVLLGGVNDQPEHAREVLVLLAAMRAKVNLIVWNPGPGIDYVQPTPEAVAAFQKLLIEGGIATYIRRPRGRDIYAACGQLKRTVAEQPQQLTVIGAAAI